MVICDTDGTMANAVAGHGGCWEAADVAWLSSVEYVEWGILPDDSVGSSELEYTVEYSHICG